MNDKNQDKEYEGRLGPRYVFASDEEGFDIPTHILDSQNGKLITYKEAVDLLNTRPEPDEERTSQKFKFGMVW